MCINYHSHCSIPYLACCANMCGIVISSDSEVKHTRQDTEEGWRWERKRSGGIGIAEKEEAKRGMYPR